MLTDLWGDRWRGDSQGMGHGAPPPLWRQTGTALCESVDGQGRRSIIQANIASTGLLSSEYTVTFFYTSALCRGVDYTRPARRSALRWSS